MLFGEWGGIFHFQDTSQGGIDVMTVNGSQLKLGGAVIADSGGVYYAP